MAATTNFEADRTWGRMASFLKAAKSGRRLELPAPHAEAALWLVAAGRATTSPLRGVDPQYHRLVDGLPQIDIPQIIPRTHHGQPRHEGFNSDGGTYVVTANLPCDLADMSHVKSTASSRPERCHKVKTNLDARPL
jgi:hypothetical protein